MAKHVELVDVVLDEAVPLTKNVPDGYKPRKVEVVLTAADAEFVCRLRDALKQRGEDVEKPNGVKPVFENANAVLWLLQLARRSAAS